MFHDPSGANAVRNSNRFDSKPSEALNPVGINLQCALNPHSSRRPRLRPRGASAPEGGPLARREQRGIISNGINTFDNRNPPPLHPLPPGEIFFDFF